MFDAPPPRLIDGAGRPVFGVYGAPIPKINLKDFDCRPAAPFPLRLSQSLSRLCLKRWQYIGVVSPRLVLGLAIVDIGYFATTFLYVYDRRKRSLREWEYFDLTRRQTRISPSSTEGTCEFRKSGVLLRMEEKGAKRRVEAKIGSEVSIDFTLDESRFTPLCVVTQNGLRGFNYCHKAAGLPVAGHVQVGGDDYEILEEEAAGVVDWTAGCLSRNCFWNWASGGGRLPDGGRLSDGRRIGINFASGFNERGFTENVYWIDGKPSKVDTVLFEYDPKNILAPWRIRSSDRKVDLVFHPEEERSRTIELGLLGSRFHQPFGRFQGKLKIGRKATEVEFYGFVEEHQARW